MSVVYKKSRSDKYGQYFAQIPELTAASAIYSLDLSAQQNHSQPKFKEWEHGRGGVPLSWEKANRCVRVDHTDNHTLVIGPTGSKKSRLVVMPLVRILGGTGESMIISDPKAEIYNRTAGFLKEKNYDVYVLNLRSPMHGNQWNPLSIPYDFYIRGEIDKSYEFVNDIAENLIQAGKSEKDPFWDNSAGSFLFGLIILLFKYCKENGLGKEYVHMGNIVRLRNEIVSKKTPFPKANWLWEYAKSDSIISSSLIGTVETANDTKLGILSVFDQKVRMFSIQPNLLDLLSASTIDIGSIGRKPTAVFLIVPDEKTGYHGLVSLFIKQSYEYMIFLAQRKSERDGFHVGKLENRVNYVLDEFSSLPTIRDFPAMVTAARSRNIRFTLVIQSKHQLIQRYGDEAETIQTNCNNWIFLTSRELQLLKEISDLCGNTLESPPRPILSEAALQRLDKEEGEALLLCARSKPCITKLADIDEYDNRDYRIAPVEERERTSPSELVIEIKSKADPIPLPDTISLPKAPQITNPPGNILNHPMDINDLIKKIDEQIEELERQQASEALSPINSEGEKT